MNSSMYRQWLQKLKGGNGYPRLSSSMACSDAPRRLSDCQVIEDSG